MFVRVAHAKYLNEYKIYVKFNDGKEGVVDLASELYGPVFEPLKELGFFKRFHVDECTHTIVWDNGADLAPEFLYERVA